MKKHALLTLSVVLGLAACQPNNSEQSVLAEPSVTLQSGIDLQAMDPAVRPQDDFFRYVNGAWISGNEIPADKSSFGVFNIIYDETQEKLKTLIIDAAEADSVAGSNTQKLGAMYNSYMNEALANQLGITPLQAELKMIAGVADRKQAADVMGQLYALGVQASPLGFYVYPDLKNPEINALYFYQSGLTLPDRDYYSKQDEKFVNFRTAMEKYVADILTVTGHANPQQAAKGVMDLETRIAKAQVSRVEARDANKNYNKRTASEAAEMLAGFDYAAFAKGYGIDHVDQVILRTLPFFEAIGGVLAETELTVIKDYMTYKLVDQFAGRLDQQLVDLSFDFHSRTLRGVPEQRPRWKRAVAATSSVLGELLGQQYVERHFTPEAKAKMDTLVANLIKAYGQSIEKLSWMTPETKAAALVKLGKFTPKIGYPDKWRDYSALELKADDLVGNYKRYAKFQQDYYVQKIGKPIDKHEWGMPPQTINAYYSPGRNEIVFPAGILQSPFFSLTADDAVNYGAIGAVIGHEIGHGFDDQGSKYDGDGNLRNWWSEEDRSAFDALGKRLVDQFSAFEPLTGEYVNGELTLGENIGDLAGVTIGLKAYQLSLAGKASEMIDGFTGQQRFFIGYAQVWRSKMRDDTLRARLLSDPHSPGEYRVNGIVPNVDAFYKAFDVKPGDGMYLPPEERVKIW